MALRSFDRDLVLSVVVLAAFLAVAAVLDAGLSTRWVVLGGLATVGFEALSMANYERVRGYWERPAVQASCVAGALALAVLGALVAPSRIPSAGIGALGSYLGLRVLVAAGLIRLVPR